MDIDDARIYEADLETVYELLEIFALEDNLTDEERVYLGNAIVKVKEGIDHKFDALYIFTENIDEDIKNQIVTIPNSRIGKPIDMLDFTKELKKREIFGKKVLLDLNHEEGFFRGNQE